MSDTDPNKRWSPASDEELAQINPNQVVVRRLEFSDPWYERGWWGVVRLYGGYRLLRCAPEFGMLEHVVNLLKKD